MLFASGEDDGDRDTGRGPWEKRCGGGWVCDEEASDQVKVSHTHTHTHTHTHKCTHKISTRCRPEQHPEHQQDEISSVGITVSLHVN